MNRRQAILRTISAIAAATMAGTRSLPVNAQPSSSVDFALTSQNWATLDLISRHRRLAHVFANLRIDYQATEHEQQEGFAPGLFNIIDGAFGRDPASILQSSNHVASSLENGDLRENIERHMNERLTSNTGALNDWFDQIGLTVGPLRSDLLNAQAVFAVFAIVKVGKGDPTFADKWTWIWPFC